MVFESTQNDRRKFLQAAVCAVLLEYGIQNVSNAVIETLVEMQQSIIVELSRSAQSYSELCGRSSPLFGDVFISLIEMGINTQSLINYGKQKNHIILPNPQIVQKQPLPKILQAGDKRSLFPYIPDHFPSFPDAHAYIRTDTHKQPVTEYEAIREKASSQKRDLERALTRFMAKTSCQIPEHSLFPDEESSQLFPLIPQNIKTFTYLSALLPRDQIFEDDANENKDKKQEEESENNKEENENKKNEEENETTNKEDSFNKETENDCSDNPYLRPTKICRRRGGPKLINLTK